MHCTIILLQSLDGFIARDLQDDLSWGSKADKNFFREKVKEAGLMILGKNTYNQMPARAFKNCFSAILTRNPEEMQDFQSDNMIFSNLKPYQLLADLEKRGFEKAVIAGGGQINNLFLEAGLVDEIYVTIAPIIFAQGVKSFGQYRLHIDLQLLNTSILGNGEILLHYKVKN